VVQEGQIKNSSSAIAALVKQLHTRFSIAKGAILHSAENTGQYAHPLCQTSAELHFPLWLEDAFQLNRSMGRRREKNDRIDARGIAEYTRRFTDKAKLYELPSKFQLKMKHLAKVRQHILGNAQRSKTMFQEMQQFSLVPIDTRTVEIFNEHLQQMKHQLELRAANWASCPEKTARRTGKKNSLSASRRSNLVQSFLTIPRGQANYWQPKSSREATSAFGKHCPEGRLAGS
jgi:transposase